MDNVTKWRVISCLLDLSKDLQGGEIRHQDNIYKFLQNILDGLRILLTEK